MGAATALYSATCFAQGIYSNGYPYPVGLRAIVGISSWLPGYRYDSSFLHFIMTCASCCSSPCLKQIKVLLTADPYFRNLRSKMEASYDAARRAASLPILLCHGLGTCHSLSNIKVSEFSGFFKIPSDIY